LHSLFYWPEAIHVTFHFLPYWLAKSNFCAINNHIALSCKINEWNYVARECNMVFYCTEIAFCYSSVVIVLLHTALFYSNFEILWKLWNLWNFLKILSFWIFLKSYEIFEIFKLNFYFEIYTWTWSIWGFMEQSTTILNSASPRSILLYSAPLNLILIKFKCSNWFVTYGSILL
jgi:hypothetical protein